MINGSGPRACFIGEAMLELARDGAGWKLGYGGDTVNTAVHMARYGVDVAYLTAVGTDAFSEELVTAWTEEGVDTASVLRDPVRLPGLYAISTDAAGERSFTYWRGESAARHMFDHAEIERVLDAAAEANLLCFSLITLAILPPEARSRLMELCDHVRARGGRVAFDGNYRARLWPDADAARQARDAAIARCDIGLPTLEDEIAIDGAHGAYEAAARWRALGAGEVVVKLGAEGCLIDGDRIVPPPAAVEVVDSSGAGDAFNAGYLHARLSGAPLEEAALAGHRLAGWTITHRGAIPARDRDAPYGSAG